MLSATGIDILAPRSWLPGTAWYRQVRSGPLFCHASALQVRAPGQHLTAKLLQVARRRGGTAADGGGSSPLTRDACAA